ncbi:DUF4832 domain-containing protein [Alkaliflexus imshenetskii]|uniref:DUF4832 domain-containing protein n=1 Tax=Alkaliflexus imshenetskii TaxID=286730 RepID=UPI0004B0C9BF|nr:DUF4832 domain-containing protein [Alkaliflexus imshenetskii]
MKLNLLLSISLCFFTFNVLGQTSVTYTETNEIIANPERGLQKYSITNASYNNTSGYTNLSQSTLEGWRTGDDKVTVIFRYFLLDNFINSNISQTYLSNIQNDFNVIRNAGLKCIVRFSYSNAQSSSPQQPIKSRILTHINQLAPLLEANKDVIYSHQAGFLGTWGEWYYTNSEEFGTDGTVNSTQWANRKEIVDAMLSATPVNVPVQVRYPKIKQTMYGTTQLTPSTAYQNTPIARVGFYNDAFLNTWGDQGTYSGVGQYVNPVGTADYVYLANETRYTPITGETNGLNSPRTDGANAVIELNATNWSTLNKDYFAQNITNWINSGHFPEIQRRLGYRFVLKNGTYSISGTSLSVNIVIQNVGFARLVKPRSAVLVLRNSANGNEYSYTLNTDPRTWEGQITISQTINISSIPNGVYTAHIRLADSNSVLATRSEYSIRFANSNVWDSSHGYNNLNYSFTKSSTPPPTGGDCPSINVNIDGHVNEWSQVDVYAQLGGEVFKVYNDADYVYFMFSGNSFVNYQIYIDSNNGVSGYTSHSWTGLAADFRIENGGLRQYTGSGTDWSWNNLGSLTAAVNNGKVEVRMPRSYFSGSGFKAGFRTLNSSWQVVNFLPAQQSVTDYVICLPSSCPNIDVNVDGSVNEWAPIDIYAQVGAEMFKVYDDADYVYFMYSGNSFANYQIYIDSNNGASGYTSHSWTGLAADFRIENGGLRQYTGSGTDWSWNNLGSLTAAVNNGKVEVRMPRSYFSGSGFKAGFRTLNSSWQVISYLPAQQAVTEYAICTGALKNTRIFSDESRSDIGQVEQLFVYPNPVKDVIFIRNELSVSEIRLFSVEGVLLKKVLPNDCLTGICQVSVSDLTTGVYFLVVKTGMATKTIKIIKN